MRFIKTETTAMFELTDKGSYVFTAYMGSHKRVVGASMFWHKLQFSFKVPQPKQYLADKLLAAKHTLRLLDPRPVYAVCDSRDCDHYRVIYSTKLRNYREFITWSEEQYDNAEGPTGCWLISKEEHEEFEVERRDYVMEARENGHPHSVDY
jgi:hypothetical protein